MERSRKPTGSEALPTGAGVDQKINEREALLGAWALIRVYDYYYYYYYYFYYHHYYYYYYYYYYVLLLC